MSFIKEDFELQVNKQLLFDSVSIWPEGRHLYFYPSFRNPRPELQASETLRWEPRTRRPNAEVFDLSNFARTEGSLGCGGYCSLI